MDVFVAGDGRPLVLLHGWGLSGRAYEEAMIRLADRGFRVIAPNTAVAKDWSVDGAAELAAEAMAAVEAAPAPVVGHSFGGVIGSRITLNHTDFVTAFVAVNSPLISMGGLRLGRILLPGTHYRIAAHGPAAAALIRAASSANGLGSLWRSARWFLGSGHDEPLRAIADLGIPRAIVWATYDTLLPAALGRRAAEELSCELITIDNPAIRPDHDWPFKHPDLFAGTIDHVLREVAQPRPIPGEEDVPERPPREKRA